MILYVTMYGRQGLGAYVFSVGVGASMDSFIPSQFQLLTSPAPSLRQVHIYICSCDAQDSVHTHTHTHMHMLSASIHEGRMTRS